MLKKIGYTLLALYVLGLILIALFFRGVHSVPKTLSPAQKKEWLSCQERIVADPNDLFAKYDLAILCAYTNKLEKAAILFNEINTVDTGFAKRSIPYYKTLLKRDPKNWRIMFKLAVLNYIVSTDESHAEVVRLLRKAVFINPDNAWMHAYYAYATAAYYENYGEAILHTQRAIQLEPEVSVFHFLLAEGYSRLGKKELAEKEKDLALRLKMKGK